MTSCKRSNAGFSLVEIVMALALIGIVATMSIDYLVPSDQSRLFDQTRVNLEALRKAILGDEKMMTGGHRTSFGYVGDWGALPTTLTNLTTAQAPAYAFDSTYHVGAGWNGPYVSASFGTITQDAWKHNFVYSTGAGTITSYGGDNAVGGTGINQDLVVKFATWQSTVSGRVLNGNNALSGYTVEIRYPVAGVLTAFTTNTDANGNFAFTNVPYGMRSLGVTAPVAIAAKVLPVDAPAVQVPGDFLNFYSSGVPTANMDAVCCRLSLSATLAVTTTDTTATTLYLQPYLGGTITVFDGAQWVAQTISAAVSIARPALSNRNYDVFVYANGGAVALELIAWANDTTRATALGTQDGVLVKGTDSTHRYFGTIRMNAGNRFEDSAARRFTFNYYNRVSRELRLTDATATWNYSTNTWRAGDNSTTNRVEVVIGQPVSYLSLTLAVRGNNSKNAAFYSGIAEDATNRNDADIQGYSTSNLLVPLEALLHKYPATGYHYYQWTENGGGTATTSYAGNGDSGLFGIIDM